uniref:Vesicle transport protein n=1 Tax=Gouania willdenowi TaxID=441366 RepID=A0A8C5DYR2_GOUWI
MDKLKSVLSGEESLEEASSLSWATRIKGFIVCFVIGAGCTILGVCMLFLPRIGLTLFIVLYTFGNICSLGSMLHLHWSLVMLSLGKQCIFTTLRYYMLHYSRPFSFLTKTFSFYLIRILFRFS